MWSRNCPNCGIKIQYKREDNYCSAVRDDTWCKQCSAAPSSRNCPACGRIVHHSNRQNCLKAERQKQICAKCEAARRQEAYRGEGNPFFGRKHTTAVKDKIKQMDRSFTQTEVFRQRRRETSKHGPENPMYGTSVYELWVAKFGVEEADERLRESKKKWSASSSGEKNPMFGRPTPQGSGNGWKGWYKGWFFRSLRELSYMVNVIERNQHDWQTAETKQLSIPYVDPMGRSRTYRADFLLDNKLLVEVKPTKLKSSRTVRAKEDAAVEFCRERGWDYEVVDPPKLTDAEIKVLHDQGVLKFMDRYETLYQGRYADVGGLNRDDSVR